MNLSEGKCFEGCRCPRRENSRFPEALGELALIANDRNRPFA